MARFFASGESYFAYFGYLEAEKTRRDCYGNEQKFFVGRRNSGKPI